MHKFTCTKIYQPLPQQRAAAAACMTSGASSATCAQPSLPYTQPMSSRSAATASSTIERPSAPSRASWRARCVPSQSEIHRLRHAASRGHVRVGDYVGEERLSVQVGEQLLVDEGGGVLGIGEEGGAEEDNAAFSPVLDVVSEERGSGLATHMNHSGPVAGAVTLRDLLPETFES